MNDKTASDSPRRDSEDKVERLLASYVDVCNRALLESRDRFLYRQMKQLNRLLWDGANFRTVVYDADPDDVRGEFTLHFDAQRWRLELLPPGDHDTAFTWRAPLRYLRDVAVNRPDWYVANPIMLDWNWLTGRLHDAVTSPKGQQRSLVIGVGVAVLATAVVTALLLRRPPRRSRYLPRIARAYW
jgi:hypothetical protein